MGWSCASPHPQAPRVDATPAVQIAHVEALRGQALDQDGRPVARRTLWLLKTTVTREQGRDVDACYLQASDERNVIAKTETDEHGQFHFDAVEPGRVWIGIPPERKESDAAIENDFAAIASAIDVRAGGGEREIVFKAWRGRFIRGVVQKPDGSGADKRWVTGFGSDIPGVMMTKSDERGAFALGPVGPEKLQIGATGAPDFLDANQVRVGADDERVVLTLAEGLRLSGRVVDVDGRPAIRARIANFWTFDRTPTGTPLGGLTTDADGRFDGVVEAWTDQISLVAYSSDRTLAGVVDVNKQDAARALEIRIRPSIRVHGRIASSDLARAVGWTNTYWTLTASKARIAQCISTKAEFDLLLPAGAYSWNAYGSDVEQKSGDLTLSTDSRDVDLGVIDLPATFLALHKGKELPPWKVTDARGLALDHCALSDFKGKWVLVEFWGYW